MNFLLFFLIAKYLKPAEEGSPKKNPNICSLTQEDWIEILEEKSKTGKCLNDEEISSLKSNWNTVFQGFYPKTDILEEMTEIETTIKDKCDVEGASQIKTSTTNVKQNTNGVVSHPIQKLQRTHRIGHPE